MGRLQPLTWTTDLLDSCLTMPLLPCSHDTLCAQKKSQKLILTQSFIYKVLDWPLVHFIVELQNRRAELNGRPQIPRLFVTVVIKTIKVTICYHFKSVRINLEVFFPRMTLASFVQPKKHHFFASSSRDVKQQWSSKERETKRENY